MYFKQGYNVDTNIVYLSKFTWRRYIELLQLAPSAIQVKVQTHGIWSNGGDNTCKTESKYICMGTVIHVIWKFK